MPKPIPPPLFRECEAEECPAQINGYCDLCEDEDEDESLDDTISINEEVLDEEENT